MGRNLIPAYEPGTKVRLAKRRKVYARAVAINDQMRLWFGKTVTITKVYRDTNGAPYYSVKENSWVWDNSLIEGEPSIEFVCESSEEELTAASFGRFFTHFTVKD